MGQDIYVDDVSEFRVCVSVGSLPSRSSTSSSTVTGRLDSALDILFRSSTNTLLKCYIFERFRRMRVCGRGCGRGQRRVERENGR